MADVQANLCIKNITIKLIKTIKTSVDQASHIVEDDNSPETKIWSYREYTKYFV